MHLFRNRLQVRHSRAKVSRDTAAQFRAPLNTEKLTIRWEQKTVLYLFKAVLVNGFVVWEIGECEQCLHDETSFGILGSFRDTLGEAILLSDIVIDVAKEVLQYADELDESRLVAVGPEPRFNTIFTTTDIPTLRIPQRNRIPFLSSLEGRAHRHSRFGYFPAPSLIASWCVLCRKNSHSGDHTGRRKVKL